MIIGPGNFLNYFFIYKIYIVMINIFLLFYYVLYVVSLSLFIALLLLDHRSVLMKDVFNYYSFETL